ncbi:MAG: PilZ domain-containing protein [Burkholderiaceae bacterium]
MMPLDISDRYLPEAEDERLRAHEIAGEAGIRRLLEQAIASDEIVTLFPSDQTDVFVLTRIIALGAKGLLVDIKTDEGRLEAMRPGAECIGVCVMHQVKIQFHMKMEQLDDGPDGHVLQCALPSRAYRIQRREAFRVRVPPSRLVRIVVRDGRQGETGFAVHDLSVTGLRLVSPASQAWTVGGMHEHARLEIDDQVPMPCTLRIVAIEQGPPTPSPQMVQVACELWHLPGAVERRLQQFVTELERGARGLPPL